MSAAGAASRYPNRVREFRESRGWTQDRLVVEILIKTGVSITQQLISLVEHGEATSLRTLTLIADTLGVGLADLLTDKKE